MPSLFDTIKLGAIEAPNRIFMAPLTRARATREHVPTPIMAQYYAQRASAGLIISEATAISQQGMGWPFAPGLWTTQQVEAWKPVTEAVHRAGGRIVAQLWHMGRLVHPDFLDGAPPVSASATTAPAYAHTHQGKKPNEAARALNLTEIPGLIDDYVRAARSARVAGFDGVQIHAANGYLIDQFLRDGTNFREDAYGGVIENRIRLLGEVTKAVADAIGADRTGVRLSPNGERQGVNDTNPEALFAAAAALLSDIGIAFLEVREPGFDGTFGKAERAPIAPLLRQAFKGPFVLNSDYRGETAQSALDEGRADAISFGRTFLANPDLPDRIAQKVPLNADDQSTWYSQGPAGYIDYPSSSGRRMAHPTAG
ncbi:alkene reductase [Xanthobacter wiegelii]|uniref:alkene reductase n=1 Tax=Xanthobacter wiegelii TaxID=3119913 RepID=UPI003728D4AE